MQPWSGQGPCGRLSTHGLCGAGGDREDWLSVRGCAARSAGAGLVRLRPARPHCPPVLTDESGLREVTGLAPRHTAAGWWRQGPNPPPPHRALGKPLVWHACPFASSEASSGEGGLGGCTCGGAGPPRENRMEAHRRFFFWTLLSPSYDFHLNYPQRVGVMQMMPSVLFLLQGRAGASLRRLPGR